MYPTNAEYSKMAKSLIAAFPSSENKGTTDCKWVCTRVSILISVT